VPDLRDHSADFRRVQTLDDAADAVETEPDQRFALAVMPSYGTRDLLDRQIGLVHRVSTLCG
jgi:hypothetical protein